MERMFSRAVVAHDFSYSFFFRAAPLFLWDLLFVQNRIPLGHILVVLYYLCTTLFFIFFFFLFFLFSFFLFFFGNKNKLNQIKKKKKRKEKTRKKKRKKRKEKKNRDPKNTARWQVGRR
jgi:hypothetical protein